MPFRSGFPHAITPHVLESVVETAIDGIILIDPMGNILMANSAVTHLFGYSREEILNKNVSMLMPTPHREQHDQYLENYLTTGAKKIIGIGREVEGRRKDGSTFPVRLAVSEIHLDQRRFFTGILQDLTQMKMVQGEIIKLNYELEQLVIERTTELQETVNLLLDTNRQLNESIEKHKEYENALEEARDELHKSLEKEKELGSLKSRFVSMASHEFKTPLASILSSAALVSKYTTTEQEADRARHVERIKTSVSHLNNILTDFLSITKMEEGNIQPVIRQYSLDALMEDLRSEVEGILKKDQQFICEPEHTSLDIQTDKVIFRNIVYNLTSNAVKYSDEGKMIRCTIHQKDNHIEISIEDQGMGIPFEDQKHIGTRFFRASNAVHVPGTGLGLNIVMAYLQTLKGNIHFTSEPGQGTTFHITLPIHYETENPDH